MRRNKKGQAAMEFLMTYGWAILVVLAAIGALAYFGVLNPGNWLPTKCTMQGGFSCLEYKATPNGTTNTGLYLKIQNNLGADAVNATLNISSSDCTFALVTDLAAGVTMQNGDVWNGSIVCTPQLAVGDRLRGKMLVSYRKAGETQFHEATGEISTKVEN